MGHGRAGMLALDPPAWHGRTGARARQPMLAIPSNLTRGTKHGTKRGTAKWQINKSPGPGGCNFPCGPNRNAVLPVIAGDQDGVSAERTQIRRVGVDCPSTKRDGCLHTDPSGSGPRADRPPLRHHPDEWEQRRPPSRPLAPTLPIQVPDDHCWGGTTWQPDIRGGLDTGRRRCTRGRGARTRGPRMMNVGERRRIPMRVPDSTTGLTGRLSRSLRVYHKVPLPPPRLLSLKRPRRTGIIGRITITTEEATGICSLLFVLWSAVAYTSNYAFAFEPDSPSLIPR